MQVGSYANGSNNDDRHSIAAHMLQYERTNYLSTLVWRAGSDISLKGNKLGPCPTGSSHEARGLEQGASNDLQVSRLQPAAAKSDASADLEDCSDASFCGYLWLGNDDSIGTCMVARELSIIRFWHCFYLVHDVWPRIQKPVKSFESFSPWCIPFWDSFPIAILLSFTLLSRKAQKQSYSKHVPRETIIISKVQASILSMRKLSANPKQAFCPSGHHDQVQSKHSPL